MSFAVGVSLLSASRRGGVYLLLLKAARGRRFLALWRSLWRLVEAWCGRGGLFGVSWSLMEVVGVSWSLVEAAGVLTGLAKLVWHF